MVFSWMTPYWMTTSRMVSSWTTSKSCWCDLLLILSCRRQELRELRLMQKEAHRAQAALNTKLESQRDQMLRRFDQELNVSAT